MSPAWALEGRGGTPQPLRPPLAGLVLWVRGDVGVTRAAGRVSAWADQSDVGQNLVQVTPTSEPYDNGDAIDGIPLIEFGTGAEANKFLRTSANFVDRFHVDMDNSHARTYACMTKPKYYADYDRIGGPIVDSGTFQAGFELYSGLTPSAAYAWARGWLTDNLQWGPQTGGALSPFNDVPTLVVWKSAGYPQIDFLVNNVTRTLTPATQQGGSGGASPLFLAGTGAALGYLGGASELLGWDHALDAAEDTTLVDYMRTRYPTAPIVVV